MFKPAENPEQEYGVAVCDRRKPEQQPYKADFKKKERGKPIYNKRRNIQKTYQYRLRQVFQAEKEGIHDHVFTRI